MSEHDEVQGQEEAMYDGPEEGKPKTKKELAAERKQAKLDAMIPEGTMVMCDDGVERPVKYRETAIEEGVNRYFTGEKCKNGHMCERKVKGYVCTTCARIRQKERHKKRMAEDPEYKAKFVAKRAAKRAERYANDPEYRQKAENQKNN